MEWIVSSASIPVSSTRESISAIFNLIFPGAFYYFLDRFAYQEDHFLCSIITKDVLNGVYNPHI